MRSLVMLSLLSLTPAASASPSLALGDDWLLTVSGQVRPRLVVDSGRDFVDTDREFEREFVTQRTRLGFAIARRDGPRLFAQLQDVRIWGEEASTLDYSARGLDLHQAYAEFPMLLLTARLGRQEIIFDDARLIGNVDWAQRARSFDAGRLMVKAGDVDADLFIASVEETDVDPDGHTTKTGAPSFFGGAHAKWQISDALAAAFGFYGLRRGPTDDTRYTGGVYLNGATAGVTYEGQAWYQFGDLGGASIGAWMATARAGYTLPLPAKPSLLLWGEALSGDGTPEGVFDTLFATNHKFYGEIDVFINIPASTGALGLIDLGGRASVAPTDYLGLYVDAHLFRSLEPDAADESSFGTEFDFVASWHTGLGVNGRALFGVFVPDEALRGPRGLPTGELAMEKLFFLTIDWLI